MEPDFTQIQWDEKTIADCRLLVNLALAEDLGERGDVTTAALVPTVRTGIVHLTAREAGVAAGFGTLAILCEGEYTDVAVRCHVEDGEDFAAGAVLAELSGRLNELLFIERTMLNLIGRLCGIAAISRRYAEHVEETNARVYDTRKTTPGWRRLEKYAVGCGGCRNHRTNLSDAVLIKDNHLAQFELGAGSSPGEIARRAVETARQFLIENGLGALPVEIEVDSLDQLHGVLPAAPDIVLLDNMATDQLQQAADIRNAQAPKVELEASGGITLENLREIARTGVDRISVGSLTHAARSLDVGLDWPKS